MLTPWNGMDGASQVHLCLYIQICTQPKTTDMAVYSHSLYVCTQNTKVTNKLRYTFTHQNTNITPERNEGRYGGKTPTVPTPIDSEEAWILFFNKPTLHVPGTHHTLQSYPKQQKSRKLLIRVERAWSRGTDSPRCFEESSSGQ